MVRVSLPFTLGGAGVELAGMCGGTPGLGLCCGTDGAGRKALLWAGEVFFATSFWGRAAAWLYSHNGVARRACSLVLGAVLWLSLQRCSLPQCGLGAH